MHQSTRCHHRAAGLTLMALLTSTTAGAQPAGGTAATTAPPNLLASALAQAGVRRCAPEMVRIAALNLPGSRQHDLLLDWNRSVPDQHPVSAMLLVEFSDMNATLSLHGQPQPDGGCHVLAERTVHGPVPCEEIARRELAGQQATQLLPRTVVFRRPDDPSTLTILRQQPDGCTSISRYRSELRPAPAGPTRQP